MKITKTGIVSERVENHFSGCRNVLSPHKYFQFDQTLKNVVVNSENQLYGYFMESHLLGLYSKDLGMTWMDWEALMGPPRCVARHTWGSTL